MIRNVLQWLESPSARLFAAVLVSLEQNSHPGICIPLLMRKVAVTEAAEAKSSGGDVFTVPAVTRSDKSSHKILQKVARK